MTSSGSRIVLENSLGACSRLSTGQASNPTPFARPTHPRLLPYNSSLPVVPSFHISSLPDFFAGYNSSTSPNPPPKSMASKISMVAAEYQVRAITGDQFIVIYTRGSKTVKAWLARFLRMFNSSTDEWVAGLDVEYTTVLGREKDLKDEERKKPAVIQVCVHNICLVYHICHADVECQDFKNFLKDKRVKFTVGFKNDSDVLCRIGLVAGQPFDLQKASLVSSSQPSMLTLAAAMIDPSYAKLKKPHHEFHHAWESKTLDEDHILYAAMDAYLCLNIYKGWMKKQSSVFGSSKEASVKRKMKRDEDEVQDVDSDSK